MNRMSRKPHSKIRIVQRFTCLATLLLMAIFNTMIMDVKAGIWTRDQFETAWNGLKPTRQARNDNERHDEWRRKEHLKGLSPALSVRIVINEN